ncbi:MFS transporter [Tsuneonella sp. HG222]
MKQGSWPSIFGIYLFGICGASTVSKIIPLNADFGSHFGLAAANFGWLVSLIAVPAALFAIPSGLVVDRLGPKRVLLLASLGGILANALYFLAPSLMFVQVARLLEGFAIVHLYTAGPAMLMSTTEGNKRTRAMTLWSTYAPVGTALGLALGGMSAETDGWRNAFLLHGSLFALAGLLCLLQPAMQPKRADQSQTLAGRVRDLGSAFVSPKLAFLALAFFLLISMGLGANVTFPAYLAKVHAIPIQVSSNMVASTTVAMVIGSLGVGLLLPLGVRPPVLLSVLALVAFVCGVLSFYPEVTLSGRYGVLAAWFVVTGACMATMLAMLPTVAEAGRQGSAAALINFVGALATFLNPPLWLAISDSGQWTGFAILMAIGWSLITVLVWAIAIAVRRTAGVAPAS